jgi:hypothetical protein
MPANESIKLCGALRAVEIDYPAADEAALRHGWERLRRAAPLRQVTIEHPRSWGA